jgi:hypothetical protein
MKWAIIIPLTVLAALYWEQVAWWNRIIRNDISRKRNGNDQPR